MISNEILIQAFNHAKSFKGHIIDESNHTIIIPFNKGITEQDVMDDGMIGKWFIDNGFHVSFEIRDFEYTTKDTWINYKGFTRSKGHKATLKNRLIATITY